MKTTHTKNVIDSRSSGLACDCLTKVSAQARKQVIVWASRKKQNEQKKDTEGEFSYPTHLI